MPEDGLTRYLVAAEINNSTYTVELNELRADLLANNFSTRDFRASERLLQVHVELCIGLAKHWLKQTRQMTATDAYQTFAHLKETNQISSKELNNWRRIIGMRNGLVHDYLNIDLAVVEGIIKDEKYADLSHFATKAIAAIRAS